MNYSIFKNKTILITGGSGSFGRSFVKKIIKLKKFKKIIIFSRDELKQFEFSNELGNVENLRYLIGDVRDKDRLKFATKNVDYIVHAAALKQVPAAEYNPFECIQTNILGAQNIIEAAIGNKVKRIIALSTDKAALPINLYGASKLASDKLFTAANNIVGNEDIRFSVIRYGNVLSSRGSLVPFLKDLKNKDVKKFPLTHEKMTRFWITLDQATDLTLKFFNFMKGGEMIIPKIPSIKITDLMQAISPGVKYNMIGLRPGEKIHELMCPADSSYHTIEFKSFFIIAPTTTNSIDLKKFSKYFGEVGKKVKPGFEYRSDTNKYFLNKIAIKKFLKN